MKSELQIISDDRGSALLPILSVFFIIFVIFTSIIFYGAWHKLEAKKYLQKIEASFLAEAGVNRAIWLLSGNQGKDVWWRTENYSEKLDDFRSYNFSVENWGGYILINSKGKTGAVEKRVRALIGQRPSEDFDRAINLGGPDYPLVVTGRNKIFGDILLGPGGIMEGKFKGEGFLGDKLVDGEVTTKKGQRLPYFSDRIMLNFIQEIEDWQNKANQKMDKTLILDDETPGDFLKNKSLLIDGDLIISSKDKKLFEGPGYVYSTRNIEIRGNSQLGENLILVGKKAISLSGQALVEDCILYSQSQVILKDNCFFEGQILSDSSIGVTNQAKVHGNSFLFLKGKIAGEEIQGEILLESTGSEGTVAFYFDPEKVKGFKSPLKNNGIIRVQQNANFSGILYSSNFIKMEGTVLGSVSTNMFYLYFEPTTYINWLKDSIIDRRQLKKEMVLPLVFMDKPELEIVKYEELN